MKRVLLVDDDALVVRAYRDRLSAHGFQVNTAPDGMAAINLLRSARPDLIVLDLMMPNLSGVEVLKFIRAEPRLAKTPVVVLTNAYLNDLGRQAATIGIDRALLKSQCSPQVLMSVIDEIFRDHAPPVAEAAAPASAPPDNSQNAVHPTWVPQPAQPPVVHSHRSYVPPAPPSGASAPQRLPAPPEAGSASQAGTHLLARSTVICADLRTSFQAFARTAAGTQEQKLRLQDLYRKVHFLTATAALTDYWQVAQIAAVFEALLYVLMDNPSRMSPSVRLTLANLVDFLELLFNRARQGRPEAPRPARVLVVDDDPLANRLAMTALTQARLEARSSEDPLVAWQWVQQERFDLVLLDIEMPGMTGLEFCKQLRALPGYAKTPVIYVTVHNDFETRAKSTLSGGDDLIAKPILPMELAAKVVMHLFKRQAAA